MNSPLRNARLKREKTLQEVATAVGIDTGNLSRIERGEQIPNKDLAEKLVNYYGNEVSELQIIYPERFASGDDVSVSGMREAA